LYFFTDIEISGEEPTLFLCIVNSMIFTMPRRVQGLEGDILGFDYFGTGFCLNPWSFAEQDLLIREDVESF
jgi:hypothetical protein